MCLRLEPAGIIVTHREWKKPPNLLYKRSRVDEWRSALILRSRCRWTQKHNGSEQRNPNRVGAEDEDENCVYSTGLSKASSRI